MKTIKTWLATIAVLLFSIIANAHEFEVDGIYYNKTSNTEVSVTYRGSYYDSYSNEYSGNVVIPSAVTYLGKEYSVTSIGGCAFYECSGLTSVTIPNSVTSIGDHAFYECSKLRDVYCYAENVPTAYSYTYQIFYAFDKSYIAKATLHVPAASIDSYKATEPWRWFGKIVALTPDETGIDELKGENGKRETAVYDLSGRRVQKEQKGIFIQNGKVMVK